MGSNYMLRKAKSFVNGELIDKNNTLKENDLEMNVIKHEDRALKEKLEKNKLDKFSNYKDISLQNLNVCQSEKKVMIFDTYYERQIHAENEQKDSVLTIKVAGKELKINIDDRENSPSERI